MSQQTAERRSVPKRPTKPDGGDQPRSDRITVKLDRELMRKASAVADWNETDKQDYLEELLRPLIEADYRKFLQHESESIG